MRWGKGWQVGTNKAIYLHERAMGQAAAILANEHGIRHSAGERADFCPLCGASLSESAEQPRSRSDRAER